MPGSGLTPTDDGFLRIEWTDDNGDTRAIEYRPEGNGEIRQRVEHPDGSTSEAIIDHIAPGIQSP